MKRIPLHGKHGEGKFAIVDDEDFDYLNQWKWYVFLDKKINRYYVIRNKTKSRPRIWMHRLIMNTPKELVPDHKDGNGFNNQKNNLRNCTQQQNRFNSFNRNDNTSGYKGVCFVNKKWRSRIGLNGKRIHLGYFNTKEEAYEAYKIAAKKYHGQFANF